MSNLSLFDVLIYTPLPFGQLWARIFSMNNSTDNLWLLVLTIVPIISLLLNLKFEFTAILLLLSNLFPLVLMKMEQIKPGTETNSSSPLDKYILFPIILKLLIMIFLSGDSYIQIYELLILFIPIVFRKYYKCKTISGNILMKSIIDTTFIYSIIEFAKYIITSKLHILQCDDNSNGLFNNLIVWFIGLLIGYSFINLVNDSNLSISCNQINNNDMFNFMLSIGLIFYLKQYLPLKENTK